MYYKMTSRILSKNVYRSLVVKFLSNGNLNFIQGPLCLHEWYTSLHEFLLFIYTERTTFYLCPLIRKWGFPCWWNVDWKVCSIDCPSTFFISPTYELISDKMDLRFDMEYENNPLLSCNKKQWIFSEKRDVYDSNCIFNDFIYIYDSENESTRKNYFFDVKTKVLLL